MAETVPAGLSPAEAVAYLVSKQSKHHAEQADNLKRAALNLGPDDPIPAYVHQEFPKMVEVAEAPATPEAPAVGRLVTVNSAKEEAALAPAKEEAHG